MKPAQRREAQGHPRLQLSPGRGWSQYSPLPGCRRGTGSREPRRADPQPPCGVEGGCPSVPCPRAGAWGGGPTPRLQPWPPRPRHGGIDAQTLTGQAVFENTVIKPEPPRGTGSSGDRLEEVGVRRWGSRPSPARGAAQQEVAQCPTGSKHTREFKGGEQWVERRSPRDEFRPLFKIKHLVRKPTLVQTLEEGPGPMSQRGSSGWDGPVASRCPREGGVLAPRQRIKRAGLGVKGLGGLPGHRVPSRLWLRLRPAGGWSRSQQSVPGTPMQNSPPGLPTHRTLGGS